MHLRSYIRNHPQQYYEELLELATYLVLQKYGDLLGLSALGVEDSSFWEKNCGDH